MFSLSLFFFSLINKVKIYITASLDSTRLLFSYLRKTLKFVITFVRNHTLVIKIDLWYNNKNALCSGREMNFSSSSHSMRDISSVDETTLTGAGGSLIGAGGSLRRIPAARISSNAPAVLGIHASSLAGEPSSADVNPSPADLEDTDIFSHGSPIGEDFHPDNSVLDSDDGDDANFGTSSRTEIVVNMDTGPHISTGITSGNSTVHEHHLDVVYYQCRSARTSKLTSDLISINNSTFGQKVTSSAPSIGSFEDHLGIEKTFHGSRFQRGPQTVNQSISASFDPAKLICISCDAEHPIIRDSPTVLLFSD
jgi:hypothetical protein